MGEKVVRAPDVEVGNRMTLEQVLDENAPLEKILTLLKAGLATTPFAGGIASLLSDHIPSARFRRLENFTTKIAEDLSRLQDRVSTTRMESEQFAWVFEQSFRGAADDYRTEKFEAFRAILVNSAIPGDLSAEEEEFFLGLVTRLSVLHLRILRFMAQPREYLADAGIPEESIVGGFETMFATAIPGVSADVVESAFQDLYDAGLTTTGKNIFGTITSDQGLQLLGGRVSKLGARFIKFCTLP